MKQGGIGSRKPGRQAKAQAASNANASGTNDPDAAGGTRGSEILRGLQGAATNIGTWRRVETRLGTFCVASVAGEIVQTALPKTRPEQFEDILAARHPGIHFREDETDPLLVRAASQLEEYSQGTRRDFDLPLRAEGTAFQSKVWRALAQIPYGTTRSYQEVARDIGRPGASRAVGQANHHNPLAPLVPCHRVVNSTGGLGGYGGGMDLKKALLDHEGVDLE